MGRRTKTRRFTILTMPVRRAQKRLWLRSSYKGPSLHKIAIIIDFSMFLNGTSFNHKSGYCRDGALMRVSACRDCSFPENAEGCLQSFLCCSLGR
jgi:hypothetical protein